MKTERMNCFAEDGRRIAVWRSSLDDNQEASRQGPIVILSPGFARRMRDVGAIALCLVHNGCTVYRFDALNHTGLSDGKIEHFNIADMTLSCRRVIELAREAENCRSVNLGVLSIATLAAFAVVADDPDVEQIVAISGVVDGVRTLKHALGFDYSVVAYDDLPALVQVEGHEVDPRRLWRESRDGGALTLGSTVVLLNRIGVPITNFVASGDPWVDIADCEQAFASSESQAARRILELPYGGHDIAKNPAAIKVVLREFTSFVVRSVANEGGSSAAAITLPSFDELLSVRSSERDRALAEFADMQRDLGRAV